ncbi:BQ2448_5145 [Microbotryum intermedium]|uniref:BQ2448_5145 protein n=1 Tax=Microbotryum intermedium TaxID=269621 RepID=A0A238F6P5_9BASI|nr:BQ2448_5145 [Microbotryum intermedium]
MTLSPPRNKRQRRLMSVAVKSWSLSSPAGSTTPLSQDCYSSAHASDAAALSPQASRQQGTTERHPTRPTRTATDAHTKKRCPPRCGIWVLAGWVLRCHAVVALSSSSGNTELNRPPNLRRRIPCSDEQCGFVGHAALQRSLLSELSSVTNLPDSQGLMRRSMALTKLKKRQDSAIPTPSASSSAPATSTPKQITIPDGWKSIPRETNYYAVPVIVAISVLVAILVITTVVGSAIWRRKKHKRKRKHPGEIEKGRVSKILEKVGLGSLTPRRARGGTKRQGGAAVKSIRKRRSGASVAGKLSSSQDTGDTRDPGPGRSISDGRSGDGSPHCASPSGRPVGGYRSSTASTIARIRRRREQRAARAAADDDRNCVDRDEDDESRALTGSHSSRNTPEDTLTARIAARLLAAVSQPSSPSPGPSTVFRELERAQSALTTQSVEALSRVSSRASTHSRSVFDRGPEGLRETPSPVVLSEPDPTRSDCAQTSPESSNSARFGASSATAGLALPIPGPPAYRPASTTIAMTTRFSTSRVLSSRPVVEDHDPADMWHWPNEKGLSSASTPAPFPSGASSSTSTPHVSLGIGSNQSSTQPDSTVFAAHIATDDKAILARLRQQVGNDDVGEGPRDTSSRSDLLASATAPVLSEDDDQDVWLGFATGSAPIPAPSAPIAALLPAPSQPVRTTFDYSAPLSEPRRPRLTSVDEYEQAEMGYLPVYERRRDAEADHDRIMARATAPPPASVDDSQGANGTELGSLGSPRLEHREV